MVVKVVASGGGEPKYDWPKIKTHAKSLTTVLFTGQGTGTVLAVGASKFRVGEWANNWDMTLFVDDDRKFTLENE